MFTGVRNSEVEKNYFGDLGEKWKIWNKNKTFFVLLDTFKPKNRDWERIDQTRFSYFKSSHLMASHWILPPWRH